MRNVGLDVRKGKHLLFGELQTGPDTVEIGMAVPNRLKIDLS